MATTALKRETFSQVARAIYVLSPAARARVMETVAKYLSAEGKERHLPLVLEGAGPARVTGRDVEGSSGLEAPRRPSRRRKIAFGWYGGKFSHLNWLLPLLPQAHHYCEPFGGSAAVLLNREPSPVETYNDVDGEVVNFFRVLRETPEELIRAIGLTPFSREEFMLALRTPERGLSEVERARRFFTRARQVRTGLAQTASAGRWANCKGTSRAGMAGAVSRWLGSVDALADIALRLLRVQIENRPALEVVRIYDAEDVLLYCDPPYPHEARGDAKAYRYEMTERDHRELARALGNVKAKVAVSGYRCDLMDTLYRGWRCVEGAEKNCHSVKKPRTEALWVNY